MGNYNGIKSEVHNAVYENSVGAVTGEAMQELLTEIVNSVGLNSNFMGILSAVNKPTASVDSKQFYIGCNESSTPLSIDLSAVDLGTLTINQNNIWFVFSDASGWQKKDLAAGISEVIPTTVAELTDANNYNTKPEYVSGEGTVTIASLKSNCVYNLKQVTGLTISAFGYDINENMCFGYPPTLIVIQAIGDFDVSFSGAKTLNGAPLHCEANKMYLLTVVGYFAKIENYV